MAKRIERSRIESGKVELPRKLGFLTADKVDFLSVTDRDGEFSVEMPVPALSRLVKAKTELRALKGQRKSAAVGQATALQAEKDAHAETQAALAKAERRIKSLTKKLEEASSSGGGAAAAQPVATSAKGAGKAQPRMSEATKAAASAAPAEEATPSLETPEPVAPKKVSRKSPVAEAVDTIVAPPAAPEGPAALH